LGCPAIFPLRRDQHTNEYSGEVRKPVKKLYEKVCKAEVFLAALCFCSSCLVIFVSAIARSIHRPLNWSLDISLFLFAWSVFLAADVALRADKLVNLDIVAGRLPERARNVLSFGVYVLILVFLIALLVFGVRLCYTTRARAFQGLPRVSYTWVTLSVPVGAALQIVTVAIKLKASLKRLATRERLSYPAA
jgi:TRAP-type C4-dicarboxylate transport system permease small subunit